MPRAAAGLLIAVIGMAFLAAGCSPSAPKEPAARSGGVAPAASQEPASGGERARIVALGDSLTAGYGLDPSQSFPALLQGRIDRAGYPFEVVNMGVAGDTSAGGVRRLDWALEGDVRILILALGGNDGLRGLPPPALHDNLATIIERAQARGVAVLLCGMEAPPNLGRPYTAEFRQVYHTLAREKRVELLPFLLEGVAGVRALNQDDGIHPNAAGASRVADLVWGRLEPMLRAARTS
jgi:acyl-CoA thioesterase-1